MEAKDERLQVVLDNMTAATNKGWRLFSGVDTAQRRLRMQMHQDVVCGDLLFVRELRASGWSVKAEGNNTIAEVFISIRPTLVPFLVSTLPGLVLS